MCHLSQTLHLDMFPHTKITHFFWKIDTRQTHRTPTPPSSPPPHRHTRTHTHTHTCLASFQKVGRASSSTGSPLRDYPLSVPLAVVSVRQSMETFGISLIHSCAALFRSRRIWLPCESQSYSRSVRVLNFCTLTFRAPAQNSHSVRGVLCLVCV